MFRSPNIRPTEIFFKSSGKLKLVRSSLVKRFGLSNGREEKNSPLEIPISDTIN
jgi:hypothetical protein